MADPWNADREVPPELARRLIQEHFPDIAAVTVVSLGEGWDNAAYLVDGEIVFRFPRRNIAANLLEREAQALPLLAPHLPVALPVPTRIGTPTASYPWVFAGYPLIPGSTADRVTLTDQDRANLAPQLARFLKALHQIPIDSETTAWAPRDDLDRANIPTRAPKLKQRLLGIRNESNAHQIDSAIDFIDQLTNNPTPYTLHPTPSCWVHGDLYSRHLLLDDEKQLTGIIDWGDVHLGDPALDLSIAFSFLPPTARLRFRESYGIIEENTWDRARFRALHYAPILIEYGLSTNDPAIESAGRDAINLATQE